METSMTQTRNFGRHARKLVMALALGAVVGGASAGPALADDDWRHERREQAREHEWREHAREHEWREQVRERERREHEWREREREREWREHHAWIYAPPPAVVYAPPPVVYAPPTVVYAPPPGIRFVFPINIR